MKIVLISAIITVLVFLAPHTGVVGSIGIVGYAVYALFTIWSMASLHLFMTEYHTKSIPPDTITTLMQMLDECRMTYPSHNWLVADILLDITQVIYLFYFGYFWIGGVICLAHILAYSIYFRLPSFDRSI